jgi:predicted dehydrogenase/threonine dehydrogenase-like Zn-dependent dehydrogenase
MKQVSQNKKTGAMNVADVPPPALQKGMILVKNYASVISAGTEKSTIDKRKASLIERAKSQPDDVKKVIDEVKRSGLFSTYSRVMSKLDSSAGLGYSTAGIVLAVDESVDDIEVGDKVACAGAEYAFHSDVIVVPRNLVARIPQGVSMEAAAYSTVAAIAMQGIRQTEPTLGETIVVIGLGLLGQITVQMLKANGCRVIGVDLDPYTITLAEKSGADLALHRQNDDVQAIVMSKTGGHGADGVIITAGTNNNDPVELAGKITRERGRVIVVGATKIDVPRETYYPKEIDIRISRSYGPGRYNSAYEEKGLDYPIGYVRWTENRNMQAYLQLVKDGRMDMQLLTTHKFTVQDALKAYALIEGEKTEPYVGILLTYEDLPKHELSGITTAANPKSGKVKVSKSRRSLSVGFIGAGSFASGFLVPPLKEMSDVSLEKVCNKTGLTGADMRNKFGFQASTTNAEDIFDSDTIGTVFIATRHGNHAEYTARALEGGKHVFVEKPLALNEEELSKLETLIDENREELKNMVLMVGYNRRFSPLVKEMKSFFGQNPEPSIVHYYVNAGYLPLNPWTHDPVDGGGRVVGEICHFIDTIQFLTGADPVRISADNMFTENEAVVNHDNVNITMRMSDGSLGIITYAANGDTSIPKERIVMSSANASAVMDNFSTLTMARGNKQTVKKSSGDKGHKAEIQAFMDAIRNKKPFVIPYASLLTTSRATFAVMRSLNLKEPVSMNPEDEAQAAQ